MFLTSRNSLFLMLHLSRGEVATYGNSGCEHAGTTGLVACIHDAIQNREQLSVILISCVDRSCDSQGKNERTLNFASSFSVAPRGVATRGVATRGVAPARRRIRRQENSSESVATTRHEPTALEEMQAKEITGLRNRIAEMNEQTMMKKPYYVTMEDRHEDAGTPLTSSLTGSSAGDHSYRDNPSFGEQYSEVAGVPPFTLCAASCAKDQAGDTPQHLRTPTGTNASASRAVSSGSPIEMTRRCDDSPAMEVRVDLKISHRDGINISLLKRFLRFLCTYITAG
jgi:hypothetical protein